MKKVLLFAVFLLVLIVVAWNALWYFGYFKNGETSFGPQKHVFA